MFPDHQTEFATVGVSGNLPLPIHSGIVRTPKRLIAIDAGIGNDRDHDTNPLFDHLNIDFFERLANAGVQREAVDMGVMTHLHIDHVGWSPYREGGRWQSDLFRISPDPEIHELPRVCRLLPLEAPTGVAAHIACYLGR